MALDALNTDTPVSDLATIRAWEEAEMARSSSEAKHTPLERLRMSEWNLRRYLDPPADTAFPLEYAFHQIGNVSAKTVLDYGCGNGENSLPLAKRGARVIGVDVSADLLALARQRLTLHGVAEHATFLAGSAHDLPLPDASVDAVMGIAILHHLDLALAAREVHRVLRPGGIAVFQEPVRNSRLLKTVRGLIPYRSEDVSDYERPLTDAELRSFAAPFRDFQSRAFSLPFINLAQVVPMLSRHILALYKVDGAILRRTRALDAFAGIRVVSMRK
ncbi:MAG TPA: class I SAM-dependent methyltransferase [Vicinamibacterales bacterium]|nr:class I SAM-dependent methyltransferase [Vicinamibacterales bacterium]